MFPGQQTPVPLVRGIYGNGIAVRPSHTFVHKTASPVMEGEEREAI